MPVPLRAGKVPVLYHLNAGQVRATRQASM
jgi:hypothetical protein